MDLGERLKLLRKDKGMNQPDVAKILGVSVPTISSYENGTRTPDIDMMVKISELYNISIDNLVGNPSQETSDLKELLRSGSLSYGGKEISEENIEVISKVVKSFLEE